MKFFYRLCSFAALAAIIVGCCNCRALRKKQKPLTGTEWQLVQLGGRTMQPVEDAFTLTLDAAESRVFGCGGCNRFMGSYTLGEDRALTFGELASTRMMCHDAESEQAYFDMLDATTHYDMDGEMLLLFSNGDLAAIFQPRPADAQTDAPETEE